MALEEAWSIHEVLPSTRANGPGLRFGVWVQGCSLGCAGCFNPSTHVVAAPRTTVGSLLAQLDKTAGLEGVTVSGGEPLEQPEALGSFLEEVRLRGLSSIVLTGYTRSEIQSRSAMREAVDAADVVVSGRYSEALRVADGLRGSRNKEYWFLTNRYASQDFERLPQVEVLIQPNGDLVMTGMRAASEVLT